MSNAKVKMEANKSTRLWSSREVFDGVSSGTISLSESIKKSRIWTIFAKLSDANGVPINNFVCCRTCKIVFTFNKSSCTSNLVKHKCYKTKYKLQNQDSTISVKNSAVLKRELQQQESKISIKETQVPNLELQKQQTPISIIETEVPKLEERSNIPNEDEYVKYFDGNLTKLITKCLIKNSATYKLLQSDDFKTLFHELISFGATFGTNVDVDKLLPNPLAVVRNVTEIYGHCFAKVQSEIDLIKENGFGISIGTWENKFQRKNFLALTVNFFKNGTLTPRFLGIRSMEGKQFTSLNINEKIDEILTDFNCKLSNTLITVTNLEVLKAQTLPCVSSLLNNVLEKSAEEVPEVAQLIDACMKLANFLQKQDNTIFDTLFLESCCSRRWNTIIKMLYAIQNNWSQIETNLSDINKELLIESIDINYLTIVNQTLQPFEDAIEALEDENSPTLHLVFPYLHVLKKSYSATEQNVTSIENLRNLFIIHLQKIITENITILHKLALFLYPPTNNLSQFSTEEKLCIENECLRLMKRFNPLESTIKQESESSDAPVSKRRKLFSDFEQSELCFNPDDVFMRELQIYKLTCVKNSEDFNVFSWWEAQKNTFPYLYKLMCSVLATPASCAMPQRILATNGCFLSEPCSVLISNKLQLEPLMFIKLNAEQLEEKF